MGIGKSTIAEQLSKHLFCKHIDLDKAVEASEKCSVEHIFETKGESFFRESEERNLREIFLKNKDKVLVISLGGGALISQNNRTLLQDNAFCIYLKASIETITSRLIHAKKSRPLIKNKTEEELSTEIRRLFSLRESGYNVSANYVLQTDNKNVNEILGEILRVI